MKSCVPARLLFAAVLLAGAAPAQERRAQPGRVVDADGRPVANASVQQRESSWRGSTDATAVALRSLGNMTTMWLLGRAQSGADGRLDLPFLLTPDSQMMVIVTGGTANRESAAIALEANDEPLEVSIR